MYSIPQKSINLFWSKIDKSDTCWVWTGFIPNKKTGYGRITIGEKRWPTHRLAYFLAYGAIDDTLMVLHRCDNPPCCNPDHLFQGTALDNMLDKSRKQRGNAPKGTDHGLCRLTPNQVREIRAKYATGNYSLTQLSSEYGVVFQHISGIINRRFWKHLD